MKLLVFAILAIPSYAIPAHQVRGDAVAVTDGLSSMTKRAPCAANDDPQSSLTLCPDLIQTGYSQDGQNPPVPAGQSASLTSSNNFINFCLTVPNLPLTNGKQITSGSCNAAPQGVLAATTNMPSSKFTNPANLDTIKANTTFDITMAISHLQAGNFVNAQANYYAAPQQVASNGDIIGHSHFVIEKLTGIKQVTPTSPGSFVFFKGVNTPAPNGILSVPVVGGIDTGFYRLSSINTAANHQPVLVAVAQHGALDDTVYFMVTSDGAPDPAIVAALGGKA